MSDKPSGSYETAASLQQHELAFANEISTSTLVRLLVQKGILSPDEILEAERQMRLRQFIADEKENRQQDSGPKKRARLKKWASKRRWSRRLTARLFGWEWKRAKVSTLDDAGQ